MGFLEIARQNEPICGISEKLTERGRKQSNCTCFQRVASGLMIGPRAADPRGLDGSFGYRFPFSILSIIPSCKVEDTVPSRY